MKSLASTYLRVIAIAGAVIAPISSAPMFTQQPSTTCANNLFNPALVLTPSGAHGFTVTGTLTINTTGGGACNISWEIENTFNENVTGMWTNTSALSGTVDIPANGAVTQFREDTEHAQEAGTGVATAVDTGGVFGFNGGLGGRVGATFAAAMTGTPFFDAAGETNELRQDFRVDLAPPAAGGQFVFHFPVGSDTTAIPEPRLALVDLLLFMAIAGFAWKRRSLSKSCST